MSKITGTAAKYCEAICDIPQFETVFRRNGVLCPHKAKYTYHDKPCCWVHWKAANNINRPKPIKWK